jgi:hypothetical protein
MERKEKSPGAGTSKIEGEGSYTASKDYNERTRKFVESGKVDQAAKDAHPSDDVELERMKDAERTGQRRGRGEDPALHDPGKIKDDPNFPRKPGKDAQPSNDVELDRMKDAERTGQHRGKGEEPAPRKPGKSFPPGEGE